MRCVLQTSVILSLCSNARGKVWGSDEINVEGWKPLKRLPGHDSDVTDVAWSPSDRYLASVGLDSKVIIWDGYTLGERMLSTVRRRYIDFDKSPYGSWSNTTDLSRACAGILLESFLLRSLTTRQSRSGERRIGVSKLR